MKQILFSVIIIIAISVSCKKDNGFVISGKITNSEGRYLYLDELRVSSSVPVDSVLIKKDGNFKFKGKIGFPNFYLLRISDKNFITLLVDTTEIITVKGDAANFSHDYVVEGSQGSILVQELNNTLTKTKLKIDSLRNRIKAFRNREDYNIQRQKWEQELIEIRQKQIDYSTEFIQKHPFSMSSVLALYQKFDDSNYVIQDLHSLKVAASALNSIFPKSEHVKALYANTQRLMLDEKNSKIKEFISQTGENSPNIVLPDQFGNNVALSSLSGKIILIQFWSALSNDSRIQNQALVELYNKYKSKNFEIYQVSVDTDRDAWIQAIKNDGLVWKNVGDMKGSNSAINNYNIQRVPSNYILDRERKIVARDLVGPALDKAIGALVK